MASDTGFSGRGRVEDDVELKIWEAADAPPHLSTLWARNVVEIKTADIYQRRASETSPSSSAPRTISQDQDETQRNLPSYVVGKLPCLRSSTVSSLRECEFAMCGCIRVCVMLGERNFNRADMWDPPLHPGSRDIVLIHASQASPPWLGAPTQAPALMRILARAPPTTAPSTACARRTRTGSIAR